MEVRRRATAWGRAGYLVTERLLPSGQLVQVLIVQDAATISRWYFADDSPLPVGVDVQISVGADECRLRFDQWKTTGERPVPGRIGVVDGNTESIRWIILPFEDL